MNFRVTLKASFSVKVFVTLFTNMLFLLTYVLSHVVCQCSLLSEARLAVVTLKFSPDLAVTSLMVGQMARVECLEITSPAFVRFLGFLFNVVFILHILSLILLSGTFHIQNCYQLTESLWRQKSQLLRECYVLRRVSMMVDQVMAQLLLLLSLTTKDTIAPISSCPAKLCYEGGEKLPQLTELVFRLTADHHYQVRVSRHTVNPPDVIRKIGDWDKPPTEKTIQ